MVDPRNQLERLREQIRNGERGGNEDDRDALLLFDRRLSLSADHGHHRHLKHMSHATAMAEQAGGLADALEDRVAAEEIVRWIMDHHDNPNTNRDFRVTLRVFGDMVTDGEGIPASISWVSGSLPNNHNPRPNPAEMLTKEDVESMVDACKNSRDKALIMTAFDLGARPHELIELRVGDVQDTDKGLLAYVDGKTGSHPVYLRLAVPHLVRWLSDHPAGDDPDAPLWSHLSKPKRPSHSYLLKIPKQAAKRAGVTKPVTFRNFRRSNATFLAKRGAKESFINERQGRKPGSPAIAHYVAAFGENQADQYAKLLGEEVEGEEFDPIAPLDCPRCEHKTPRDRPRCVFCGQILDVVELEEQREKDREARRDFFRVVAERPEMVARLEKFRDLMGLFEEDPELVEELRAFAGELEA